MRKKRNGIVVGLLAGATLLVTYSWYLYTHPEKEATTRQKIEESLANAYIEALVNTGEPSFQTSFNASSEPEEASLEVESEDTSEEVTWAEETSAQDTSEETDIPATEWSDPNYYTRDGITYTPDYAKGELLGVLEVEKAKIRRGVYGGSWEAIQHDLDIWMVTEARPDYELGKTHMAIYGHNHTVQDLSFNRLKDVVPGDVFTYTTDSGVWIYDVTRFFADWRELVTQNYVDNFSLPADKCYLISCGRNEYRYKDIVVEGTLRCVVDVKEYQKNPSYYKYEYDGKPKETAKWQSPGGKAASAVESSAEEVSQPSVAEEPSSKDEVSLEENASSKKKLQIEVSCASDGLITAACMDESGEKISCEMALFDADGLMVTSWAQPEESMPSVKLKDNAEYIIAALEGDFSENAAPEDVVFRYHGGKITRLALEKDDHLDENGAPSWAKPAFFAMAAVFLLLVAVGIRN